MSFEKQVVFSSKKKTSEINVIFKMVENISLITKIIFSLHVWFIFKKKVFSRKLYNIKPNIENKMLIYGLKWKCLCVVHQPTETDPTQKRIIAVSIKKNFLLLYLVLFNG